MSQPVQRVNEVSYHVKLVPKQTLCWVKRNSSYLIWHAAFWRAWGWKQGRGNVPCNSHHVAPRGVLKDTRGVSFCLSGRRSGRGVTTTASLPLDMHSYRTPAFKVMQGPWLLYMRRCILSAAAWVRMPCMRVVPHAPPPPPSRLGLHQWPSFCVQGFFQTIIQRDLTNVNLYLTFVGNARNCYSCCDYFYLFGLSNFFFNCIIQRNLQKLLYARFSLDSW